MSLLMLIVVYNLWHESFHIYTQQNTNGIERSRNVLIAQWSLHISSPFFHDAVSLVSALIYTSCLTFISKNGVDQ